MYNIIKVLMMLVANQLVEIWNGLPLELDQI